MIPETISELEGAVSVALAQKKLFIEANPEVIDTVLRSETWREQGYIIYRNVRVYGLGMREESERKENRSIEDYIHGKGIAPSPAADPAPTPRFEGQA